MDEWVGMQGFNMGVGHVNVANHLY